MSGIYGYINKKVNKQNNENDIKKMGRWNLAYGGSSVDVVEKEQFSIGCSFDDLSEKVDTSKKIIHEDAQYAVIDAVIYNKAEFVQRCGTYADISDEALLYAVIKKYGMDELKSVNGDFSGAIYDEDAQKLTLFRDHMGIRPLFYYEDAEQILFSTDLRGITTLEQVDVSFNKDWIYQIMNGYIGIDMLSTEYEKIFCVRPASYLEFNLKSNTWIKQETIYWKLGSKKVRLKSEEDYKERLKSLITDAVSIRLNRVDGLVGAELSGGIDSGVIDILIHRLGRECIYFSWSQSPEELPYAEGDERLVVQDICNQEHISCHYAKRKIQYDDDSKIVKQLKKIGFQMKDESLAFRFGFPASTNTLHISQSAEYVHKNGGKVVFTGHGGDEGVSHRCNSYEMFYHHEYYHFLRYIYATTHGQKHRILKSLRRIRGVLFDTRKKFQSEYQSSFYAPEYLKQEFSQQFKGKTQGKSFFAYDPVQYILNGGSRNRLDNVALLGAYSGVRYMVPFLDYRVIDYAVSIPRHLYLKSGRNRYIFREAFKDIMPESLYSVHIKEDKSRTNIVEEEDWYPEFAKNRKEIVDAFDRKYWKDYIDFDKIDQWIVKGRPTDEERQHDEIAVMVLSQCAMVENMVKKSRNI